MCTQKVKRARKAAERGSGGEGNEEAEAVPCGGYWGIDKQVSILQFDNCHADGGGNIDACQRVLLFKAPDGARLHLNMSKNGYPNLCCCWALAEAAASHRARIIC